MSDTQAATPTQDVLDKAVAEGGAYEVLHKRLLEQGQRLRQTAERLNASRLEEFGDSQMDVIGRVRIRTENNCIARDIVQVGDCLLFGYNVFIGLRKETGVADVFSLYRLVEGSEGYEAEPVPLGDSFLAAPGFVNDFNELYTYYKNTRLLQLAIRDGKLLASFQIGERITDIRVFRWSISSDGSEVRYIDNRGERDIALPAPFDFEWQRATREMVVEGRFPHLNILDTLFVETIGGDLTIKVENNTEVGLGIYREEVMDKTQSLDDAQVEFARLGSLLLLKVLPYREEQWRYLVFNSLTGKVERIDAIGLACIQLPEDHGIIFPGGYYLQNGEYRTFEQSMEGMRFKRSVRSPNGEDVQYVFYHPEQGRNVLLTYNLINRQLQNPLFGHGYARLEDGRMVIFAAEGEEPTRIHPMQVWQTPFCTEEYAARQPARSGFLGRIGNAELVRGVSDLYDLCREIETPAVSIQRYSLLCQNTQRLFDVYHWLGSDQLDGLAPLLREVAATAELVLDEYEKVESIRRQSAQAMVDAEERHKALLSGLLPDGWDRVQQFVDGLNGITAQRGLLLTIREYRYIDVARLDAMEAELLAAHERVAAATATFLASEQALQPLLERLQSLDGEAQKAETVAQLGEPLAALEAMAGDLDMLSSLMASLRIDDATQRTRIIESISEIYARLNQAKARAEQRRKGLGSSETVAQFGAQFKLFGQGITNALAQAQDPERCDEQLSRLLVQLEELESQFGDHEQFLGDILAKREELLETFEAHKQTLLDERQRKAQGLLDAARRILDSLQRRTARFTQAEELNAFFAADPLILKLRELAERLRELKDSVKADDVEARLKAARDQAVRALRDKSELFEEGGDVIRLGPRHRFSVNTQELDLTLMPRGDALYLHLTGTDFLEPLQDPRLDELREFWQVNLESESETLYRAEYLAGEVLAAADAGRDGFSLERLQALLAQPDELARAIRDFAAPRYKEGYEKGIHDHDAAAILVRLLPLRESAGLLRYAPSARAFASLFWSRRREEREVAGWPERARSSRSIQQMFGRDDGLLALRGEVAAAMRALLAEQPIALDPQHIDEAAEYLVWELSAERPEFTFSKYARQLQEGLKLRLQGARLWDDYRQTLERLGERPAAQWELAGNWLRGLCGDAEFQPLAAYLDEAVALSLLDEEMPRRITEVDLRFQVDGLMGEHPRIFERGLALAVDDFFGRLRRHRQQFLPGLRRYQALRQEIVEREREALRLAEFKPRPLSSFVRNKLINDVYLGVIGDNLAKQMGTVGENKRTDLMGLLMLISPPGYGKTTLMEYVAHRLGLIFMKINGPALGHEVRSLDPGQAPDATSRQELEKLNLALEMGNNVMLYVDDIQHTHPEFLQKFISLCDGTRRVEGVWKGRTKTYDMRGRKFCVVMAGNPYTESGEVFRIPDMLANRADIYNLGDTLSGMQEAFSLSYIENALTSNPVLAPLATRDMADVYRFVAKAEGKPFSSNELAHGYSGAEINEISSTLQRLMQVRDVVLKVNQQYIASAAQADQYRSEPPFKLQGSYRNMNKMAEKISAVMNDAELLQLIADHYQGESQLLTTGAEENLLKLAELRGNQSPEQAERWAQIKRDFLRNKSMGGSDADVGGRLVAQLNDLVESVRGLAREPQPVQPAPWDELLAGLRQLGQGAPALNVEVTAPAQPGVQQVLESLAACLQDSFLPLIKVMDRKIDVDLRTHNRINEISSRLDELGRLLGGEQRPLENDQP
ncbi:DNA repair ATPase [Pseudomonas aeruginosa]|uniref:DNA repair ATPase n=1 Tax=Pseudomonas aeruginosa TaxID=287 RepID=UPI000DEF8F9A|nr:DNA repair ATPase [Pseudomonas aeruginosa]MCO1760850.1 AAA family ATPase [Pseudomonas aeruginosa]MCV4035937.1 DNA repair ATPase [Pseudomonas aeruginosa]RCN05780.1 ATPase involved in DNA repair [Pseudomonas aeruginosa]HEJ3684298.1 DNA repair ATPase [Pseudomonas aeruginosa]HEJ4409366.1 DNA repair ATPase [Pseudomonas aeruginosa]